MAEPIVEAEFTLLRGRMAGASTRGARRYRCDLATLCRIADDGGQTAWVHDVSAGGIGLTMQREMPLGSHLMLRLRKSDRMGFILVGATVVHCTAEVNGNWRVGCSLDRPLTDDELDSCLG